MTSDEIKKFIVDMRTKGIKFEAIANMLNEEMSDKRYTRQSVFGLYSRYMERMRREDKYDKLDIDIVNIYCRLNNISGTTKIMNEMNWYDIKIYNNKISNILSNQKELMEQVRNELVSIVEDGILTGDTIEDIKGRLRYKDIDIKDKVFKDILVDAYEQIINNEIESLISSSVAYCNDRTVAKELLKRYPIEDSLTIILNRNLKAKE